jgi:hypothetical protein
MRECLSVPLTILVRCESLEHRFQPARRVYPLSITLGSKADNLHDRNVFYDTLN